MSLILFGLPHLILTTTLGRLSMFRLFSEADSEMMIQPQIVYMGRVEGTDGKRRSY